MKQIEDAISAIRQKVDDDCLDKQLVETLDMYHTQVDRFCDVMADLNLYEIMKKCLEFATPPDVEESSDEEPVTLQIKTPRVPRNNAHHTRQQTKH